MRRIAATLLLAGCDSLVEGRSQPCNPTGMFNETYLCPTDLVCAPAPTYCGPPDPNAGPCKLPDHDQEHDSCTTVNQEPGVCLTTNNQLVCTACTPDILWCDYPGWYPMSAAGVTLRSVWAVDFADVYLAGEAATLIHYDGVQRDSISLPSVPTDVTLTSVFGVGSTDLFVVGANLAAHRANGNWTVDAAGPAGKALNAVWAAAPNNVFAVGDQSVITHFDGTSWTAMMTGPGPNLKAVAGTSGADVYAVGVGGVVLHYDGVSWSTLVPFSASGIDLNAAWATEAGDVIVGGGVGTAKLIRYHGGAAQSTTVPSEVQAIDSLWEGNGAMFAGGVAGWLVTSTDGLSWTEVPMKPAASPTIQGLGGTATGPTSVFAVGTAGTIWHYSGN